MRDKTKPGKEVTLLHSDNLLVVEPTTQCIYDLLAPRLSFTTKKFLYGEERRQAKQRIQLQDYECFVMDHRNRIGCPFGFYDRIKRVLNANDYKVNTKHLTPHAHPEIFEPRWDRVFNADNKINLRYGQDEFLIKMATRVAEGLPARFDCVPGYGKSFLIWLICMLYPKARIDVISDRVAVLRDRIYRELCGGLPDVGMYGGGIKKGGCRVMCYTFDSLSHAKADDADIMLCDECHEAGADNAAEQIGLKYGRSLNYGFSATHEMRLDNKNLRIEGMFGPIVYSIPYQEAEKHGLVVPIEVRWSNVVMDMDPCEGAATDVERDRYGIWRNKTRNRQIAADARRYGPDVQVLITCDKLEHALVLKKRLPEFSLVYAANGITPKERKEYIKYGLMQPDEPLMTEQHKIKLTRLFERGKLLKAICTTVWNVGVNFQYLQVLIRADAGGSPTMDTQIPGRASRPSPDGSKTKGVIHDYLDQFNIGKKRKATGRRHNYGGHGWTQIMPGATKAEKPQMMLWED